MTDQTVNIPLLRKAVEWAEAEAAKPEGEFREWEQRYWVSSSDPTVKAAWGHFLVSDRYATECGTAYCIAGYTVATQVGPIDRGSVGDIAADLLGIDEADSVALFMATNTIEDVRRIAEELAGERL